MSIEPRDPNVLADDVPRLTGQNAAILEMLRERPRLNTELLHVACKYTSRVSDIRKAGYVIECERLGGGLTRYTLASELVEEPEKEPEPVKQGVLF